MALSALGTVSRGVGSAVVYTGSTVYKVASRVFSGVRALWSHMSLRARISLVIAIPVVILVAKYIKKKWSGNPLGGGGLPPLAALPPEERLPAERERWLAALEARRAAAEAERRRLEALPAPEVVAAAPPVAVDVPPAPRREVPEHVRRAADAAEARMRLAAAVPPPAPEVVAAAPPVAVEVPPAPRREVPEHLRRAAEAAEARRRLAAVVPPPAPEVVAVAPAGPAPEVVAVAPAGPAPEVVAAAPAGPAPEVVAVAPAGPVVALPVAHPAPVAGAPDPRVAVVATVFASVIPLVVGVGICQMVRIESERVTTILAGNNALLEAADRSEILEDGQILASRAATLSQAVQRRCFQILDSISSAIQRSPIVRSNLRVLEIANYAACVMSVQHGRLIVARTLSKACQLAAQRSPELDLERSVQQVDRVLQYAQSRTLEQARQIERSEIILGSNFPDINDLVTSLEQEVVRARQVFQVRLPEKLAVLRGIED